MVYAQTTRFLSGATFTEVFTANADGSGQTRIVPADARNPAWSPDGRKIICLINNQFSVMDADGTNRINLGIGGLNPSWSVRGKIAFEAGGILTMNPDGTNVAAFPGITQPAPSSPAWSPDGTKLAFSSGGDVWVINADGTNERRVTTNNATDSAPAWSPDGRKIAFSKRGAAIIPTGSFFIGIAVINVDGTNEVRLTGGLQGDKTDTNPSWSSDGTKIAFARGPSTLEQAGIYVMNPDGTNAIRIVAGFAPLTITNPALQPLPPVNRQRFDFDGDNKDDFAVYRSGSTPTSQSYWDILKSSDNTPLTVQFGSGEDRIVPADYNGDGRTDIAVFRPSNGSWYTTTDFGVNYRAIHWGSDGDIPLPGDFDGDGKADLCVYRPSEGVWYILRSSDGNFVGYQFGTSTDKPLLMDYDGDRKTDLAFLRVVGTDYYWFILQSSNNTAVVPRFGVVGDKVVPADYDGDGKSNLAVYRPDTGKWMILSADEASTVEYQWGVTGDAPAPGEFDGDGLTDLGIFRADTATWYVARSGGSSITKQWGAGTDMPVTAAYIP
ncbi:MAG: PD40 domain-containing protein [Acidobacteria bacterium]|nr:PD40 domain-containing protein [Acidobacteriota bacterium]